MSDDPLEELKMVPPHLDDDGFTGRVMAALPRRRLDLRPWIDGATVMAIGLAAGLAAPELLAAAGGLAEAVLRPLTAGPVTLVAALLAAGGALLGVRLLAREDAPR